MFCKDKFADVLQTASIIETNSRNKMNVLLYGKSLINCSTDTSWNIIKSPKRVGNTLIDNVLQGK